MGINTFSWAAPGSQNLNFAVSMIDVFKALEVRGVPYNAKFNKCGNIEE